jgi:hypothetical protein
LIVLKLDIVLGPYALLISPNSEFYFTSKQTSNW